MARIQTAGLIVWIVELRVWIRHNIYGRNEVLISAWDSHADKVLAGISGSPIYFLLCLSANFLHSFGMNKPVTRLSFPAFGHLQSLDARP
jgi:hypothetical protein